MHMYQGWLLRAEADGGEYSVGLQLWGVPVSYSEQHRCEKPKARENLN